MPTEYYMNGHYKGYRCDALRRGDGHPCLRWVRRQVALPWTGICWQHRKLSKR